MQESRRKSSGRKAFLEVVPSQRSVEIGQIAVNVGMEFRELLISGGVAIAAALFRNELERICGSRHSRKDEEGLASRWGQQQGEVVLGGRKVKLTKPLARRDGKEVILSSYAELQGEDPLNDRALEQMLIGVSTRKYCRSLEPVTPGMAELGVSKSAVSRRFVAMTSAQLENAMSRPLGDEQWAALLVDGIHFFEHIIVIVMGIDTSGRKHVLAFREGSTENATLCRELLSGIVARGIPAEQSILIVIDGGKGLRRAVREVFGEYAVVQRCQVHKKRNVLDHLPEERRAQVRGNESGLCSRDVRSGPAPAGEPGADVDQGTPERRKEPARGPHGNAHGEEAGSNRHTGEDAGDDKSDRGLDHKGAYAARRRQPVLDLLSGSTA